MSLVHRVVVLDCLCYCHRIGFVEFKKDPSNIPMGVCHAFLRDLCVVSEQFYPATFVFAFDGPDSKRKQILPSYKQNRKKLTEEERERAQKVYEVVQRLKNVILPELGFQNCLSFPGYEADDILAAIAKKEVHVILVTEDSDLWQCISEGALIYSMVQRRLLTPKWFMEKYGIEPRLWKWVKALSGCPTDGIKGLKGVGIKYAVRFLKGSLQGNGRIYKRILEEGKEVVNRNLPLVSLPMEGCPVPELKPDRVDPKAWLRLCSEYKFKDLPSSPKFLYG